MSLEARLEQNRKDLQLLRDEEQRLLKELRETKIPKTIWVGQIYEIQGILKMVAVFDNGDYGLTSVGAEAGCYSSAILIGTLPSKEMRQLLIDKKAKYLGRFIEVFKRV